MTDLVRQLTEWRDFEYAENEVPYILLSQAIDKLSQQKTDDRIEELEAALIAIASAPYPLHDHCTEEQWEMACNLYQASLEDDDEG